MYGVPYSFICPQTLSLGQRQQVPLGVVVGEPPFPDLDPWKSVLCTVKISLGNRIWPRERGNAPCSCTTVMLCISRQRWYPGA